MDTATRLYDMSVGGWYVVENDRVCWPMSEEDWSAMVRALGPEPRRADVVAMPFNPVQWRRCCSPNGWVRQQTMHSAEMPTGPSSFVAQQGGE